MIHRSINRAATTNTTSSARKIAGWAIASLLTLVALTLSIPQSIVDRVGRFSGMSVTLAGRNLKTWTDYSGFDPEVAFNGQSNFTSGDAGTLPPNRIYTIRLDANF